MIKQQHLLSINTLTKNNILDLIHKANALNNTIKNNVIAKTLSGKIITLLFFEPSTRTSNSFLIAAKHLDAITLNPIIAASSTTKGESLLDTVKTFEALGTQAFIVRHPDNNTAELISNHVHPSTHIINAGDGTNEHPSQALIDLMTIQSHINDFSTLRVAIVGDINHSRVAHSLIAGLTTMGVPDIRCVGPDTLINNTSMQHNTSMHHHLKTGLADVDVIITLRIQKERLAQQEHIDINHYQKEFCITADALHYAKPQALIMHPGPINRELEISSSVADSSQSTILEQVKNGVAMRMAILDALIN